MEKVVRIINMKDDKGDREYWLGKSEIERLIAGERLIRGFYGIADDTEPRLQRVVTITQRQPR
jgi:hypothetical protein